MPLAIGMTGGIGSGKTTVARIFAELGAGVIDTDEIAHQITAPGGAAMGAIVREFGPEYADERGALDRAAMRRLVFSDPLAKTRLEAILHPLIRTETSARLRRAREPYVLIVVPLLFETDAYRELIRRTLVVDCEEATQVARTAARSRLGEAEVRAIMATQVSRAERLRRADDVIRNEGNLEQLHAEVEKLHHKYLALAREAAQS